MIHDSHGNLLCAGTDALVNTVNTVGVMGKGIALQFKQAHPGNFKAYKAACDRGEVQLGRMFVYDAGQLVSPRWIINFPTKKHWRARSKLADIESGLDDLRSVLEALDVRSVAIPPLGCGNGGLDWRDVRPLIIKKLSGLDADIALYPPTGAPAPADMPISTERPRLTVAKATIVKTLSRYTGPAAGATLIEVQKLAYFLQTSGLLLNLHFQKARYGPYADNLRHVLTSLEGHYLTGYGDGSKTVWDADPIDVLPGAAEQATEVLAEHPEVDERIREVLQLVAGFESAYGLELLATVHWVATRERHGGRLLDIVSRIGRWSDRKRGMFSPRHIEAAVDRLTESGWVPALKASTS
jgi:O-acetyl-ADP-ribose deacetylase (regulator of RNase III)